MKYEVALKEADVRSLLHRVIHDEYNKCGVTPPGAHQSLGGDWCFLQLRDEDVNQAATWWDQVLQKTKKGQTPVLLYRNAEGAWYARMKTLLIVVPNQAFSVDGDISLDDFLTWFARRIRTTIKLPDNAQHLQQS